jgi:negative regulator of flagellin synthesis FlgM
MEVQGPGSLQRSVPISPVKTAGQSAGAAKPQAPASSKPSDAVEISSAGQLLDKLSKSPEVRAERLAQIKASIASGDYDSDEKLEAALMNLLQSIVLNESHD